MNRTHLAALFAAVVAASSLPSLPSFPSVAQADEPAKQLRAGIIGLDTSHAIAFTKTLNAEHPRPEAAGCRIIAAYPKGSPDIPSSVERVPQYTQEIQKLGVEIVDSIDELLKRVDVVFLETNDGRPHLEQVLPVLKAGKPVFIDKPIAGSLADAVAIFEAARAAKVPLFSSSSLRFGKNSLAARNGSLGKISRCETTSPASLEPTHPDLFWYGIHGVELLYTMMGPGCEAVTRSEAAAQLFLGTRLQCAKCHNHPFDRWTQADYYDWADVFARIDYKVLQNKRRDDLDKHEFNGEQIVFVSRSGDVTNPRTGKPASPRFLGERSVVSTGDRLDALASWLTKQTNFARAQVNWVWFHLLGRGIVDPIDDFRPTNPPSHPGLLDELARDFTRQRFDLRQLIRRIMNSRTYQLSSRPNASNAEDGMNFSHAQPRRLTAEQLLDCQHQVLGVPSRFSGFPVGTRAAPGFCVGESSVTSSGWPVSMARSSFSRSSYSASLTSGSSWP